MPALRSVRPVHRAVGELSRASFDRSHRGYGRDAGATNHRRPDRAASQTAGTTTPGLAPDNRLHFETPQLRSRASLGEKDTGEARRAMAQLAEHRRADQAPEAVSRDFAEQVAQPPAVKAEVHEPGGPRNFSRAIRGSPSRGGRQASNAFSTIH
jgi:hypothetical protein